jgi:hypothetical protein
VRVWDADRRRSFAFANTCDYCVAAENLTFAGTKLAWSHRGAHFGESWSEIYVAELGVKRPFRVMDVDGKIGLVGNVHAAGSLILFNSWTWLGGDKPPLIKLWKISGQRSTVIATGEHTAPAASAVDSGRIALVQTEGLVIVLDPDGRETDRFSVSTPFPRGALLERDRLFVLGADAIDSYDMRTHTKLQTRRLQLGISGYARLVGVHDDVLVYVAGIAIHMVRLSTGRDVLLKIGRQAGATVAALTARGLFVGYEPAYGGTSEGRLEFIPLIRIQRALPVPRQDRQASAGLPTLKFRP